MIALARTFFGFLSTIFLIPAFFALVFLVNQEAKNVKGFHEVLDDTLHVDAIQLPETSFIVDQNKQIVTELSQEAYRIYIPFEQIPRFLIDLFIVSEDKHFYEHIGFDIPAIGRALAINFRKAEINQGASTITQQLARNYFLTHEKSYNRKLSELLYAYALERNFSKNKLLELYVNAIYYQNGAYGIEAAAQRYFQQTTSDLSDAQLAFLAAIPNNPTLYDPIKNFTETKKRQERLIEQMRKAHLLTDEEAKQIAAEKIKLNINKRVDEYPDYTTYVEAELRELIVKKKGMDGLLQKGTPAEKETLNKQLDEMIHQLLCSGVIIHTALEPELQQKAIRSVRQHLPSGDIEGAVAVIRHGNAAIVALVGGKKYKKYEFHRAFQAFRQPGSAIKPLIAYAPYFERTNATIFETINADRFCIGNYCPKNYGNKQYGTVSLETAFIHSLNVPAVRLLQQVGIDNAFSDLQMFQFSHVVKEDFRFPAAIGGFTYGMSPLELTNAFTVFTNEGSYQKARAIQKITNREGNILYQWDEEDIKVWNVETVDKIRTLMGTTVQAGTARKAILPLPYVGGKTGTSNDYKDLWFIGMTDQLTAGVWVGKDKPASLEGISTSSPQILIWRDIVK